MSLNYYLIIYLIMNIDVYLHISYSYSLYNYVFLRFVYKIRNQKYRKNNNC